MSTRHTFRSDIEGLRAIAVILVLLFHANVELLGGGYLGVDVFFVISGYLITRSLMAEAERTGGISLAGFYARRVRRLLPAAATVLATTAIAVRVLLPQTMWRDFGGDIAAATAYVVNWRLAGRSVDYLAEDVASSPVLHFWSLSVEEQYYIVWPILVLAGTWLALRRSWRINRTLVWLLLLLVALPSFAWSVFLTMSEPARAFFDTGTRMWELAVGAVAAGIAPRFVGVRLRVRTVVRTAALATLAVMAVMVSATSPWPGVLALGATLPTAALILMGERAPDDTSRDAVDRVLAVRPMQKVGAWSYSLYLWHWPPLAILAARWDGLTQAQAIAIVAISTIPAVISYRLIEDPFRKWEPARVSPRLALSLGANLSLVGLAAGLVLVLVTPTGMPAVLADADADADPAGRDDAEDPGAPQFVGARALSGLLTDAQVLATLQDVETFVPVPSAATADIPQTYPDDCHVRPGDTEPVLCDYGDPGSDVHIALVGDSKAGQWATSFITMAEEHDWRLTNITKSACELSTTMPDRQGDPDPECLEWGRLVIERLAEEPPDLVVVSQGSPKAWSDDPGVSGEELIIEGMVDAYRQIEAQGAEVVIMLDNPHPGMTIYECVAENPDDLEACTYERPSVDGTRQVQSEAASRGGFATIDMFDWICPTSTCLPVIGNVLAYRQGSHLTATYIQTLTPVLEQRVQPLLRDAIRGQDPAQT